MRLGKSHLNSKIKSGDDEIDQYFEDAFEIESDNLSTFYVGIINSVVVGYYAIAMTNFRYDYKGSERKWPALLIGQIGVDERYQGFGIGSELLNHAMEIAKTLSKEVGCKFLYLETYNEENVPFYQKNKFIELKRTYIKEKKQERISFFKLIE